MKIIAIDPGTLLSAYVVWDTAKHCFFKGDSFKHLNLNNNEIITKEIAEISQYVDLIAIEFPQSYGNNIGASILETCRWCGIFEAHSGCPVKYYGRPTIKGQIGGKNDTQVRASLRMRYGEAKKGHLLEGVKKDIWSALALAVALEENPNLKEWEYKKIDKPKGG